MQPNQRFRVVYRLPVTGVEAVEFVEAPTVEAAMVKVMLEHENIEVMSAKPCTEPR